MCWNTSYYSIFLKIFSYIIYFKIYNQNFISFKIKYLSITAISKCYEQFLKENKNKAIVWMAKIMCKGFTKISTHILLLTL